MRVCVCVVLEFMVNTHSLDELIVDRIIGYY